MDDAYLTGKASTPVFTRAAPRLVRRALGLGACVALLTGCPTQPTYDVIWLPPLQGDEKSQALAVNDAASPQPVGVSISAAGRVRPVMWMIDAAGVAHAYLLPPYIPTDGGSANAIDASGRIAGTSQRAGGAVDEGVLWENNILSTVSVLANEIIGESIRPRAMDDNGLVVGDFSVAALGPPQAFAFRRGGPPRIWALDLSRFFSNVPGGRSGLNAVTRTAPPAPEHVGGRYVAGWYQTAAMPARHALLTNIDAVNLDLGTLGGTESSAAGVSPVGTGTDRHLVVVGTATLPANPNKEPVRAFLWTRGGTAGFASNPQMENLGVLEGDSNSAATGVNESSIVVGYSGARAFVWDRTNGMRDLTTLVPQTDEPHLAVANAINTRGEIVGWGLHLVGGAQKSEGFLLRPRGALGEMTKTAPASVTAGGTLTYTFLVSNLGATARTITIRDPLPAGTTFDPAANPLWQLNGNVVSRAVALAPTSQQTITLDLHVTATSGTIVNTNYVAEGDGVTATSWASVTTTVVNQPPAVVLTSPNPSAANCPTLAPGDALAVAATASDADGTIAKVDFYADGTLIGTDLTALYAMNWQNVTAGTHCLYAIATDNGGATATSAPACVNAGAGRYDVTELPPPPGSGNTQAYGINDAGVVVGSAYGADGAPDAVKWVSGVPQVLSTQTSVAYAINAGGTIVGFEGSAAMRWQGGTAVSLGLYQGRKTNAVGINTAGKVSVTYQGPTSLEGGCLVWDGMQVTDIGFIDPSAAEPYSWCTGINDAGQVVGKSGRHGSAATVRIMLWTPGGTDGVPANVAMRDLGTLGSTFGGPWALAINKRAEVAGAARTALGEMHAFRWARGGIGGPASNPEMRDLHATTVSASDGTAINDGGVVVGYTLSASNERRAVKWACGMENLNDRIPTGSGWVLERANGVNNLGHIIGAGVHNGASRAFLLTPRP